MPTGGDTEWTATFHLEISRFPHSGPSPHKPWQGDPRGLLSQPASSVVLGWWWGEGGTPAIIYTKCLLCVGSEEGTSGLLFHLAPDDPEAQLLASPFRLGLWVLETSSTSPKITQLLHVSPAFLFIFFAEMCLAYHKVHPCEVHNSVGFRAFSQSVQIAHYLIPPPTPLSSHSPLPLSPPPATTNPLFCLHRVAHSGHGYKWIIQYVTFCVWLLSLSMMISRFVHAVARTCTSCLFMAEYYSTVWTDPIQLPIPPATDMWVVSTF